MDRLDRDSRGRQDIDRDAERLKSRHGKERQKQDGNRRMQRDTRSGTVKRQTETEDLTCAEGQKSRPGEQRRAKRHGPAPAAKESWGDTRRTQKTALFCVKSCI